MYAQSRTCCMCSDACEIRPSNVGDGTCTAQTSFPLANTQTCMALLYYHARSISTHYAYILHRPPYSPSSPSEPVANVYVTLSIVPIFRLRWYMLIRRIRVGGTFHEPGALPSCKFFSLTSRVAQQWMFSSCLFARQRRSLPICLWCLLGRKPCEASDPLHNGNLSCDS